MQDYYTLYFTNLTIICAVFNNAEDKDYTVLPFPWHESKWPLQKNMLI